MKWEDHAVLTTSPSFPFSMRGEYFDQFRSFLYSLITRLFSALLDRDCTVTT
jgi:hypothetical protein